VAGHSIHQKKFILKSGIYLGEIMKFCPDYAKVDVITLDKIKALEDELGLILLAYEKPPGYAKIKDTDIIKLKEVEKSMGVTLVAFS